jgi:hypothetical protein
VTRLNTDPNVKLPSAVKKAADAIDAAFAAAATPPVAPTPEVVPPVTPEVIPPAPDAPAAPINWEHRFNSMKGRFDASQNNVRAMSEQITLLQGQLAAAPAAPIPAELQPASLLTPEETNEYGADFLNVVGKKALEQLSPEMAQLKKDLADLNARIAAGAQSSAANARDTMNTWLDDNIPTWRAVNVTPEFHSWLALPDPFSGVIKHQLLSAAYEQNNTPRVAAFFNGFLASEAAPAPQDGNPQPDPTVVETGKIPLESLAAPGRAKTAAPSGPVEKPTFTAAQVSKFYADSAAGRYRGREEEKNRIDAQIIEAGREGRIR